MRARHAARRRRRRNLLLPVVAAAALVVALAGTSAQALTQTKYYTAAGSPQYVDVSTTVPVSVTFTISNCGTGSCPKKSTQSLGSANVVLPAGWTWSVDLSTLSVDSGKTSHWTSVSTVTTDSSGTTVKLRNDGTNSAYALAPGEKLSFVARLLPDHSGVVTTHSQAKQSNDFSGTGNDFALVGSDPVIYVGTPDHLEFGVAPSDVQVSDSTGTHYMCGPPTVVVVDRLGSPVTWLPQTAITLLPAADSQGRTAGLRYNGSTSLTETTAAGTATATFGATTAGGCTGLSAGTLGGVYPLSATATWNGNPLTVPAADVPGFSVLQFVGSCGTSSTDCTTPTLTDTGHTTAQVTGSPNPGNPTVNKLSVGVGIDAASSLSCTDSNPFRSVTRIFVANHSKAVTLVWDKKAVQWEINNGVPFWDVCFSAPYAFPTKTGYTRQDATVPVYEGLLVDCGTADSPQFPAGTYPCVVNRGKQSANEVVQLSIPLNGFADPKAW